VFEDPIAAPMKGGLSETHPYEATLLQYIDFNVNQRVAKIDGCCVAVDDRLPCPSLNVDGGVAVRTSSLACYTERRKVVEKEA